MLGRAWEHVKALPEVLRKKVWGICKMSKEVAQDDPRRVIHSLKVGLAISLVSLFYYYQPLYENFGLSAMWAVMTVVVVFEYTVGKFMHILVHVFIFLESILESRVCELILNFIIDSVFDKRCY